jgi:RNA polymerase sigma-70 factor (family 1)
VPAEPLHNEKELLMQLSGGNELPFRHIYDHYKDRIYAFALGIIRSVPIAEEIVQEAFTRVWLHKEKLSGLDNFESWLFTIARNLCYTALRKIALEEKMLRRQNPVSEELTPEEIIITKENRELVQQAVNQLSSQQKLVYTMSREEAMSYDEIAEKLNISRNTVKEHITRANASIRVFLQARLSLALLAMIHFLKNN